LKDALQSQAFFPGDESPDLRRAGYKQGKAEGQRCDPPYLRDQNLLVIVVFVPMLFPLIFV